MSEDFDDEVIRRCHSQSCSRTFTYRPSKEAIAKGLRDAVDRLAAQMNRFVRRPAPDEPGGVIYYCERCNAERR